VVKIFDKMIEEKSEIIPLRNMSKMPNVKKTDSKRISPIPLYRSFTCCQKINKTTRPARVERK
jgi:hypothetical protein